MQSIINRLQQGCTGLDICGLRGSSSALFLARIAGSLQQPLCCILPSDEEMETLARDLPLFTGLDILVFPSFEIPPYTPLSPDPATVAQRLACLHRILNKPGPFIVLTSAEAVLRRILPRNILGGSTELVIAGEETDRDRLVHSLTDAGYQLCSMVQHEGDLAVRGGIVDVFAPAVDPSRQGPLRLDFFGDTIDSIRLFDPVSQRSITELDEAVLLPASDILFPDMQHDGKWDNYFRRLAAERNWPAEEADHLYERLQNRIRFTGIEFYLPLIYEAFTPVQTLFSYLPDNSLCVFLEPADVSSRIKLLWERIEVNFSEAEAAGAAALPPHMLFLDQEGLAGETGRLTTVNLCSLPVMDSSREPLTVNIGDHTLLSQEIELHRQQRGNLAPLADRLKKWRERGESTVLACRTSRQATHLLEMLAGYAITAERLAPPLDLQSLPAEADILLVEHPLAKGFDLKDEKLHLLSAAELFGEKRLRREPRKKNASPERNPLLIEQLSPGEYVVHSDHGIGVFQGMINMEFAGQEGDFLLIEYRDNDKLYVPIDRLHWVTRYQGLTDSPPRLDRLGSNKWQTTKSKVTEAVWQKAQELLDLYARRAMEEGHRFSPPGRALP